MSGTLVNTVPILTIRGLLMTTCREGTASPRVHGAQAALIASESSVIGSVFADKLYERTRYLELRSSTTSSKVVLQDIAPPLLPTLMVLRYRLPYIPRPLPTSTNACYLSQALASSSLSHSNKS